MQDHPTESPPTVQANQIVSPQGLARIFEGVKVAKLTRDGRVDHYRVRGFHLEDAAIMAANGFTVDERTRTSPDSHGVYRVRVFMFGKKRDMSAGFFPRGWTREQVVTAIEQAYSDPNGQVREWAENERCYVGRTATGMRVVLALDEAGQVFDAFPLRARCNQRLEALWRIQTGRQRRSKFVCSVCGKLKTLCCPSDHAPKRRRFKTARRLFMCAVRAVTRRL
jgi:hypothetical protein